MEGLNTIHLFDCDITGNMQDLSQNDTTWTLLKRANENKIY